MAFFGWDVLYIYTEQRYCLTNHFKLTRVNRRICFIDYTVDESPALKKNNGGGDCVSNSLKNFDPQARNCGSRFVKAHSAQQVRKRTTGDQKRTIRILRLRNEKYTNLNYTFYRIISHRVFYYAHERETFPSSDYFHRESSLNVPIRDISVKDR